jgi:lipoprotein NlpD
LAVLNNLSDPNLIQIGQELRLFPTQAIIPRSAVVVQSLSEVEPVKAVIKEQPRLAKYKYSNTAIADIERLQAVAPIVAVVVAPKPEIAPNIVKSKPEPVVVAAAKSLKDGELEWRAPSKGRIISKFSTAKNHKGIDFDGKLGRPVTASAAGKVVYSGSGLRGYGKLIIIKHNDTYLSAYAHNNRIVVKEGQMVARAQKIAEMGDTDTDRVKLHFEIRRFGKPVDPANYLPVDG